MSSSLQHNAKQELISHRNFEHICLYSCNLDAFCDKGMAIPQIKFGFFSGL